MQSYYEINVALNGKHLFATSPQSCTTRQMYENVLKIVKKKFPKSEGYSVFAIYWDCIGKQLDTQKENKFSLIIDGNTYVVEFDSGENIVAIDIDRYDYGATRTAFYLTDKSENELNSIAINLGFEHEFEKELEKEADAKWLLSVYEGGNIVKSDKWYIPYKIYISEDQL